MRVSKEYHDGLVASRDNAYEELDQAQARVVELLNEQDQLVDEIDAVRDELADANQDRQPSDLADDIVEVFSKALTEWLTTTTIFDEGDKYVMRPHMIQDLHFVLRHTGKDVDAVLDEWNVGDDENPLAGLEALGEALKSLTTPGTSTFTGGHWESIDPNVPDVGSLQYACDDPGCGCKGDSE